MGREPVGCASVVSASGITKSRFTNYDLTMYEFDLSNDIEDMDEGDLRSTLSDFMAKAEDNAEEFSELEEQVDELEDDVELASTYFSERASEYVRLDAEMIADRFEFAEIIEMASDAEDETDEKGDEDEPETEFDDKPEKAPVDDDDDPRSKFSEDAKADLESLGILG